MVGASVTSNLRVEVFSELGIGTASGWLHRLVRVPEVSTHVTASRRAE
jgi:hypothetical protein